MTPAVFSRGMALLAEAFPRRGQSGAALADQTIALYREFLTDLTDAEFDRAVKVVIATGKFFPAVSELREAARPAPTTGDVGALFARVELRASMGGSRASIVAEFGEAVFSAVLAVGGIDQLRRLDKPTDRAFAMKAFALSLAESMRAENLTPLVGPPPDRLHRLVSSTAKVLAFPGARRLPPGRAS